MPQKEKPSETKQQNNNNRHDDFFKHHFRHKEVVLDFLMGRLCPLDWEKLDPKRCIRRPENFLSSEKRGKREADLIWEVKCKEEGNSSFLFHFEAQSSYNKMLPLREEEYRNAIVRALWEAGERHCLRLFTFTLYHGKKKWQKSRFVSEVRRPSAIDMIRPLASSYFISLKEESLTTWQKDGLACCPQRILSRQVNGKMKDIVEDVVTYLKGRPACCKKITYAYLMDFGESEEEILKKICKFDPEESIIYRTMFERAKEKSKAEGIAEGKAEGKAEGIVIGRNHLLNELIKKGLLTKEIARTLQVN